MLVFWVAVTIHLKLPSWALAMADALLRLALFGDDDSSLAREDGFHWLARGEGLVEGRQLATRVAGIGNQSETFS